MTEPKDIKIKVVLLDDEAKQTRDEWDRFGSKAARKHQLNVATAQRASHKTALINRSQQQQASVAMRSQLRMQQQMNQQLSTQNRHLDKAAGKGGKGGKGGGGGGRVGFGGGFSRGSGAHGMMQRMGKRTGGFNPAGLAGYAVGGAVATIALGAVAAVSAIVGAVVSQIPAADASYRNYAKAAIDVLGISKGGAAAVRKRAEAGNQFGYGTVESVQQMRGIARATGSIDLLSTAQGYSRAMSMDVGEMSEIMGVMTRGGTNLQTNKGMKTLERVMTHSVSAGLDKSRAGEHLGAVQQLIQAAQGRTTGAVDAAGISGLLAFLSKSGAPGLQGARGAEVLSSFDSTLRRAGGGGTDATSAFMMRAMGFGTGGNSSYYEATQRAQRGILGDGGAKNLLSIFRQHSAEKGTGKYANMDLSRMTGLSLDQIEGVRGVVGRGGADVEKQIAAITQKSRPMEEQIHDVLKTDIGERLRFMAEEETKQIARGEQIAGYLDEMRGAINHLIDDLWPVLVETIKIMKTILVEIVTILRQALGTASVAGARESLSASSAQYDSLKKQLVAGKISPEDYKKQLQTVLEDTNKATKALNAESGWMWTAFESLPGIGSGLRDRRMGGRQETQDELNALRMRVQSDLNPAAARRDAETLRRAEQEFTGTARSVGPRARDQDQATLDRLARVRATMEPVTPPITTVEVITPQQTTLPEDVGAVRAPTTQPRGRTRPRR